ncbi:MAG TPA: sigma-70 family RNA polymerase sigma factor [Fimbriiglobus sp.]|jgi:RNA polymerase sigma factor (sigma-70 family)
MAISRFSRVIAELAPAEDNRPDAELLGLFLAVRDERAFRSLIYRHTPGVRAVCRGWLRSAADIDDATQATFLVLLRRAETIRDRSTVGRWLYRTAGYVARRLKQQINRAGPLPDDLPSRVESRAMAESEMLAGEIVRLPEPYRLAIQLHYMAGLSAAAAADRIGCPRSTVLTRLARGRRLLHRRLLARGVAPVVLVAPLATVFTAPPAWAAALARSTGPSFDPKLSARSRSLSDGVARTMLWKKLQFLAAAAMIATGLVGFVIGQWASADGPKKAGTDPDAAGALATRTARPDDAEPPVPGSRREAIIRMPVGTFVKEVDVPPYGSGRITFTYEADRVHSRYELAVMGGELEFTTDAEISMASTGTIYGVLTGFKVLHVKLPPEMKAKDLGGIDFAKAWPLVEPVVNDVVTDLPFSYSIRQSSGGLTIQNFRILLAGPNPLGKLGGFAAAGQSEAIGALAYFQAIGSAVEGTYASVDAEKEAPKQRSAPTKAKPFTLRKGH